MLAMFTVFANLCVAVSAFEIVLPDDEFNDGGEIVCIPGDVNGDDSVDNADLSVLTLVLKGGSAENSVNPDVSGDGVVDNVDLSALTLILKGGSYAD